MDIKVNSVNFTADQKLITFVNDKVNKLQLFFDNIIASEVFLRVDKDQEKENKLAEIKILIPGKELFAKKQCKTFEEATDLAVEALRRQVRKHKGKLVD
ncbi:ribosome-associated translation inhibitor RaiA [Crocinitomicaceae bacterium CZZ-1]|uniref:Ribosome-associated translation inhibitor RaiA n=1 Tax=Taishania pollutisoli TaxID=2766479 RepID=A0A8J6TSW3_9FLAO|nr:ribosome-associated translation inhibitor RaiA [Taishania pollutisoli]MBC9811919.1 ribosome-associated translation inhibitor RaiA [Taishania pollutisoli]MBX2950007.1 ribosome-associated translation inhibitor RaiA [Crocinitomicaceae bacterium]NGF74926.1 ribosome-associated translation inhibitor RaiA [Fluviicola sp. SGL-29]